MTDSSFEIGVTTLGEYVSDAKTGKTVSAQQRIKEIVDAARLADQAGLDVFGVGEHHALDFAVSAVPVVLGAIAQVTERIRLTSAVTILSTTDPVREFEQFATVDLLSGGRAEMIAGRGAFIESFPLFGPDLADYDKLFAEKLELIIKLNESERVTWRGQFRPPLENAEIAPRPVQDKLPVWVGVGGTPESAIRAGRLGLPMVIAIIGGSWRQFVPLANIYRSAGEKAGHAAAQLKTAISSYVHIADTSQQAIETFYPYHAHYFDQLGVRRGRNMRISRADYERMTGPDGAYFVGSPQQVIDKIMFEHGLFGQQRFLMQMSVGTMPHDKIMRSIELLGTVVAPAVRRHSSEPQAEAADRG